MPPRGVKKGTKRARQYEHIKESQKERGTSEGRAEEIAARTVNKEKARAGESRTRSRTSTDDMSSGRRGGQRSGTNRQKGRTRDQLYNEAKQLGIEGRSSMNKDAAPARGRPAQVGERRPETAAPTYLPAAPPAGMRTRRRRHRLISDCALWGGAQPGRLAAGLLLEQLVRPGRVCGGSIRVTAGGALVMAEAIDRSRLRASRSAIIASSAYSHWPSAERTRSG